MTTKVALLHSLVVAIAKTALACSFPIQAGSKEKKKRGGSKEKQEARKRKKKKEKKRCVGQLAQHISFFLNLLCCFAATDATRLNCADFCGYNHLYWILQLGWKLHWTVKTGGQLSKFSLLNKQGARYCFHGQVKCWSLRLGITLESVISTIFFFDRFHHWFATKWKVIVWKSFNKLVYVTCISIVCYQGQVRKDK